MIGYLTYVAILGAFAIGLAFGVLIMALIAMATLGEDDLPGVATEMRQYQD